MIDNNSLSARVRKAAIMAQLAGAFALQQSRQRALAHRAGTGYAALAAPGGRGPRPAFFGRIGAAWPAPADCLFHPQNLWITLWKTPCTKPANQRQCVQMTD
jgi:hypothetical protein